MSSLQSSRQGRRPAAAAAHQPQSERWIQAAAARSDALDLEPGVFAWGDPAAIARSLQRSAEASRRRRRPAYASAMAMLCFYINRAGRRLPPERRAVLEQSKQELRRLYGR
ncbi:MAG: DUF3175 domain-containing protein [Cyanobacteriota bacterium]|nr:DUF3175 domain-containing protein [Cyanobacteriota bacterium]